MRKYLHYIIVILTVCTTALVERSDAAQAPSAIAAVDSSRVKNSGARMAALEASAERRVQRSFFSSFKSFFPFRTNNAQDEKLLSGVKVFPNPVVDQISLSYRLGKQSSVSIKVMDALGNEVMTLLNQELDAGPQNHVFETNNKLTNGFYFIRVSAGAETVVKRISVL
ncbi:T9SS type A sorting domain-containing protein [Parapedobacter luteus]|nr:T9SS type A sorting domain-containing protein [Parapedobacter luteus]